MPWARASAHVIRPLPLSSHRARASTSVSELAVAGAARVGVAVAGAARVGVAVAGAARVGVPVAVPEALGVSTVISVDSHPARTLSAASASAWSMVSPYSRRTCRVRLTYQTLVQVREPLGHVVVALLVTVYAGRRQGEVQQVGAELGPGSRTGGAEAAVVGFGAGDDVLNIRLPGCFRTMSPCRGRRCRLVPRRSWVQLTASIDSRLGRRASTDPLVRP